MTSRRSEPEVGYVYEPFKVVGVTHRPGYPDNLHSIHEEVERRKGESLGWGGNSPVDEGPISVILIRQPDNEADPNAIQVHVPWLGRRESWVGFISADTATRLSPRMDAGWEYEGRVFSIDITPEIPEKPGITIEITLVSKGEVVEDDIS